MGEGVTIPNSVIVVSIILFIVIMGLTIAHITGGYRIKQTIDDADSNIDTESEQSNKSGGSDLK